MKTFTAILATMILTIAMSTTAQADEVIPGKVGKDWAGIKTITVTQKRVDAVWKNFNQPGGFKEKINKKSKYKIMGLAAYYSDSGETIIAETQALGRWSNKYASDWVTIEYRCGEDCRADGSIAFMRDTETGVITFYYPDTANF